MENINEISFSVNCFNLKATLECGQCFRWKKNNENEYIGVISDRVIKIKQNGNIIYVSSNNIENLEVVVKEYFDLDKDYKSIEDEIVKIDEHIKEAVKNSSGLRHLNQPFFECLISYIISANNNIPRISKSVNAIARAYGKKVNFEGEDYYLFPSVYELKDVSVDEYRKLGVGFRDRYLKSTVESILNGEFDVNCINNLTTESLRKELMKLKGVGMKVADCIMLFSCGREEVFPIDVWVERVMSILYFRENKGSLKKKDIIQYAKQYFGKNAGIIQQHLFYNMRENKF
jgi:N-glycosylase/DNA lyase